MKLPFRINTPVRITSAYGVRVDPVTGAAGQRHDGFDLVSDGDRTVCAVVGGKVVQSRIITDLSNHTSEWGNYITIWGDDGHYHYYCHLAQRAVEAGATVKAGDPIGVMGSTGKSTGPHLHYEVRLGDGWTPICPSEILGIPNIASQTVYIVKPEFDDEIKKEKEEMTKDEIKAICRECIAEYEAETKNKDVPEWAEAELAEAIDLEITDGTRPMEHTPRFQTAIMCKRVYAKLAEKITKLAAKVERISADIGDIKAYSRDE